MRLKYITAILCMAGLPPVAGNAQQISVRAAIDTSHVLIGDQFRVRLELDQPEKQTIGFPEIGDSLSSAVEVIDRSSIDTFRLDAQEQIKIIQSLTVTSFDTGQQVIPPFRFEIKLNGQSRVIESDPVHFYVHSIPIDTTKGPVDIKRPYSAPVTLKEASPYIMGAILAGGLLFFLFYYLHRRKHNKPVFGRAPKPKEPAHVIALRELDRIKERKLWQQNQIKQYYSELSDTLRIYIQDRFYIPAMEHTTDETLATFARRKGLIPEKSLTTLQEMLNLADLVKFAKYQPTPDDHQLTLMNAYFFVNDTKPEEAKETLPEVDDREGEEVELK